MRHEFTDDLFSAYLDGEATAEQRALVDERLATSPEARQFLADLGELSEDLQSLPRSQPDRTFTVRVMQAVANDSVYVASDAQGRTSGRAGWLRYGVVLAATAAVLLLSLSVLNPQLYVPEPSLTDYPTGFVANPTPQPGFEPPEKTGKLTAGRLAAGRTQTKNTGRPEKSLRYDNGRPREPLVPPIEFGSRRFRSKKTDGLVFIDDLRKLSGRDVGRVLTAIQPSPNGISVVKLTVVDCQNGLDQLQFLLSRNRIHLHEKRRSTRVERSVRGRSNKGGSQQQLVAVFVQSTPDRLASVVSQLKANHEFSRLQVNRPISPTRFAPQTRNQIAMLGNVYKGSADSASSGPVRSAPEAFKKSNPGGKGSAAKSDKRKQKDANLKKSADGSAGNSIADFDRISRQLQLTIPATLLQPVAGMRTANSGAAVRRLPGAGGVQQPGKKAGGKSASSAAVAQRPMRVLFVLVCPPKPAPE